MSASLHAYLSELCLWLSALSVPAVYVAAHHSISALKQTGLHKPFTIHALTGGYEDDGLAHGWMEKWIKSLSWWMKKYLFWIFDKHFWQINSLPKGDLVMNKCTLNLIILPGIKLNLKARYQHCAEIFTLLIDSLDLIFFRFFFYYSYAEAHIILDLVQIYTKLRMHI